MSRLKDERMEEDLLIEYSSRFIHFFKRNQAAVYGGFIGLLAIIGLVIGFFIYSAQQESEAENLLGHAEQALMTGNFERALYGDDQTLSPGFTQIAENFRRTKAGNLANYYAAVTEYELENYESALAHIERFDVPEGILGVGPISLHAVLLSEVGEHEAAARMFLRAAWWDENDSTTPYHLMEAALSFHAAGMVDQAFENLQVIIRDFPDSTRATEAERLKGMIAAR